MSTQPSLFKLPIADARIQIAWNGFYVKQCELPSIANKYARDCSVVLSLTYDPALKRLVPRNMSPK